jgi:hypothetical protein
MTKTMLIRPFAAEGAEARRLGFEMRLLHDEDERIVRIRLTPQNERLRARCIILSAGEGDAIEAGCNYTAADNVADVIRDTVRVVLERAREVTA